MPRLVAEGPGWKDHTWFPQLHRFANGEVMVSFNGQSHSSYNTRAVEARCISLDGGQTWPVDYDAPGYHTSGGEPLISLPRWADRRHDIPGAPARPVDAGLLRRLLGNHP